MPFQASSGFNEIVILRRFFLLQYSVEISMGIIASVTDHECRSQNVSRGVVSQLRTQHYEYN